MSFAREGEVFIAIAALVAVATYALALNRRSWPLWLLAFGLTVVALGVAYSFREPERTGTQGSPVNQVNHGDTMGLIRSGSRADVFLPLDAKVNVKIGDITVAGTTVLAEFVPR